MSVVRLEKPRPRCRICGSRSHVTTVANPQSPRLGCCASCGQIAALFLEAIRACGEPRAQQLLARAIEVNRHQMSQGETVTRKA